MKGSELRARAWGHVKGRRLELLILLFLGGLPLLIRSCIRIMAPSFAWIGLPLMLAGALFHMGCLRAMLCLAEGGRVRLEELGHAFRRETLLTALAAAAFILLLQWVLSAPAQWLADQGMEQIQAARGTPEILLGHTRYPGLDQVSYQRGLTLWGVATVLGLLLPFLCRALVLPLAGALAVGAEGGTMEVMGTSLKLGSRRLGQSLVFLFWLEVPGALVLAAVVLSALLGWWAAPLVLAGVLAFFLWYLPYYHMAQALYVQDLFFPGEYGPSPPPRPVSALRLKAGGGGWYWCGIRSGPKAGGYLERKGLRL